MSELSMSKAEREAFLAETHVGLLSVTDEDGRAPLSIPVWYTYEPGGRIVFLTEEKSKKVRLLRKSGRATFVAQTGTLPYRYVTVEGPVSFESDYDPKREIEDVAIRYLGRELGKRYVASTKEMYANAEQVLVSIRPERWASADFSKMMPS
ncbi:MAG: pyridoxamine 5'-phosphate oxidase family protein [Candidatus Binatia bacterium]